MKRICLVIDGVNGVLHSQKAKLNKLLSGAEKMTVIVNAYNPYFERIYFSDESSCEHAKSSYKQSILKLKDSIPELFLVDNLSIDVCFSYNKDLASSIRATVEDEDLVIITITDLTNRHTVNLEVIRTLVNPIFVISSRGWAKSIRTIAAIDPTHYADPNGCTDQAIIKVTETLSFLLKGQYDIVNCCYVPPTLHDYMRDIRDLNQTAISDFCQSNKIASDVIDIKKGNPESALPNYVSTKGVNIIVMGGRARTNSKRWYVGTTAESLLRDMPCDILFVSRPQDKLAMSD